MTESICSDRTINTIIFRERIIRAASNVESKNRRKTATTNASRENVSTTFHVSLK